MSDDPFVAMEELLRQRQQERGYSEYFRVGDLVRFPLGVPANREQDYRIKAIYNNGVEVTVDGLDSFVEGHRDEDAQRLGMTHAPTEEGAQP
ncbi:hypothetical protein [Streptomyces liliifuscus]|uniref:Uncharacterized protein n=1 Tax=Streptomyces liliifuscus TaxID=2797636 RepID=A0A7T7L2E6_9ACTN|nr:hypothetical protein [Streptomyces liliifuscus]QQM45216.1 hypothetical protein JEQ17_41295 [Streptomyces liliifuscus]